MPWLAHHGVHVAYGKEAHHEAAEKRGPRDACSHLGAPTASRPGMDDVPLSERQAGHIIDSEEDVVEASESGPRRCSSEQASESGLRRRSSKCCLPGRFARSISAAAL